MNAFDPNSPEVITANLEGYYKELHYNRNIYPKSSMVAARRALESIVNVLMRVNIGEMSEHSSLGSNINKLHKGEYVSGKINKQMNSLRIQTNSSAHDNPEPILKRDVDSALVQLSTITEWFCMTYTTQFDDSLLELLDRCMEMEREHVEAPLRREIEKAKQNLREAEELADQALFKGIAVGAAGMIGTIGAVVGIKKFLNKAKAAKAPPPISGPKRARQPLAPERRDTLAQILAIAKAQPSTATPKRASQPVTPEQKARIAQIQALRPE
jgi:hypothetical protein